MRLLVLLSIFVLSVAWNPFKPKMSSGGFYSLKEKSATGKTIDFSKEFTGKVVYGVNVASR